MMNKKTIQISFKEYLEEVYNKPSEIHEAYRLFYTYSPNNAILAQRQLNQIQPINTYAGWKKLGRQVIKGSKAIGLLLPVHYKCKNEDYKHLEEEESQNGHLTFIKRFYWFGLSQTEGKEFEPMTLPGFNIPQALKSLNIFQESFKMINGNCQGYAIPNQNIIAINPLAYAPYKTLMHEIAHCLLHKSSNKIIDDAELEISVKEFEAETTAYLVCCSLEKFDHLEYSRGYIARWLERSEVKEENFKRAFEAANQILGSGFIRE